MQKYSRTAYSKAVQKSDVFSRLTQKKGSATKASGAASKIRESLNMSSAKKSNKLDQSGMEKSTKSMNHSKIIDISQRNDEDDDIERDPDNY